jgi:hypothetical protein
MNPSINLVMRAACVVIYAAALAHVAGWLPPGWFRYAPVIAVLLLAAHALELLFVFKHLRQYRGPLAVSVLLALLFGLLHWKPLMDARARAEG